MIAAPSVRLRPIRRRDAPVYERLRNGENTYRWFYSRRKFSAVEIGAWIAALDSRRESVFIAESFGEAVGTCAIHDIDRAERTAEVGRIIVAEDRRRQGIAAEMLREILDKCCREGFRSVHANVMRENAASQKLFESAGFIREAESAEKGYRYGYSTESRRPSCPICSAGEIAPLPKAPLRQGVSESEHDLFRCLLCDLLFLHPLPSAEETDEIYGEEYFGEENVRFRGPLESLSLLFRRHRLSIRKYFRSPGRVLDIGCGRGEFLRSLKDAGWSAHGVEVNATAARRAARSLGEASVVIGDVRDAEFPDEHFDLVSLYHVIEHLREPRETIDEIHRILKPGGILFFATPNRDSWAHRWFGPRSFGMGILQNNFYFAPRHIRALMNNRFDFLERSDFSLEQDPFSYTQSILNSLGPVDNLLYRMIQRTGAEDASLARKSATLAALPIAAPAGILLAVASAAARSGLSLTYILRKL